MRNAIRYLLVAGALAVPNIGFAQAGLSGFLFDDTCTAPIDPVAAGGELYITKVSNVLTDLPTDLAFDLRAKGGGVTGGTTLNNGGDWAVDPAWKFAQLATDVHFAYVTFPPTGPGEPGRVYVDSGTIGSFFFDAGPIHEVGNAVPAALGGSGWSLPANSSASYTVAGKTWPVGTNTSGINVVFAPLADVSPAYVQPSCAVGGNDPNPRDSRTTMGGIIGYNVWRVSGTAAVVPTPTAFLAAHSDGNDATGWVGYVDMTTLNLRTADVPGGSAGTRSPLEISGVTAQDLAGLQNPDGLPYSGDEYLIFQDSSGNRGGGVPSGTHAAAFDCNGDGDTMDTGEAAGASCPSVPRQLPAAAPDVTTNYWYAFQPVIEGDVANFNTEVTPGSAPPVTRPVAFTSNSEFGGADHRRDLDTDGAMDAVDLDETGTVEFISPQAEFGIRGLGLTNAGLPLLSSPVFYMGAPIATLPAFGQVALTGGIQGNDVSISFSTGLEKGTVLGYNVYRVSGDQRVRVNEQPILAQGAESNVYGLVDIAVRGRGQRTVNYMVEIVYSDGTASTMVGPFAVSLDQQPARRRR